MDDKDRRIAELEELNRSLAERVLAQSECLSRAAEKSNERIQTLERLNITLANKFADVCEKLARCIEREKTRPCWRRRNHLGSCELRDEWAEK